MNDLEVHPAAAVFPMMSDEELDNLAADIEAHGLLHPIVLDADGEMLIDGRNRLEACRRAGIEPQFRYLNGEDQLAFIASANLNRRNLTKGQQAMALAMIYPEPERLRRKGSGVLETERPTVSAARLSQARAVRRHSLALAQEVVAGRVSLDAALERVHDEQEASVSAEDQLRALRRLSPDLAEMVEDERLTLAEATAALKQRQEEAARVEANKRDALLRLSESAWHATTAWASDDFLAEVRERLEDDRFRQQWLARVRFDPERLAEVQAGAAAFAEVLKEMAADV